MRNTNRRTRRGYGCKRNQRGGGTQYYGFNLRNDMSPGLGQPAVERGDYTDVSRYGHVSSSSQTGLPGMGSLFQRGGRYMIDPSTPLVPGVDAAERVSIPCESSRSPIPQHGGASVTMNPSIYEPTAGWGMGLDAQRTSIGTPIKIEIPFAARAMNPACTKVGGRRRTSRKSKARRARKQKRTHRRRV